MSNEIKIKGKILFDPEDVTNKHVNQSSWKKIAMVLFDGDICEYYAWFIKKRFGLTLHKPVRGAHVTFVNDSMRDLSQGGLLTDKEINEKWEKVKNKWDGKTIQIVVNLDPRTDGRTWWFNVPHNERELLQSIRTELGLGEPFFGMHMSIGYASHGLMEEHGKYIHDLLRKGFIV